MKAPRPLPEEEGIPVLLRIPGMLDALLFWSLFACSSILMLWLLASTIENILRESTLQALQHQTALAAQAVSMHEQAARLSTLPEEKKIRALSARLDNLLASSPEWIGVRLCQVRADGSWIVLAETGRGMQGYDTTIAPLLRAAARTSQPQYSQWEFLFENSLPLYPRVKNELEFIAQRLALSEVEPQAEVLLLAFDATAIQDRFFQAGWITSTVISVAILIATLLSILVRIRSRQREVAERQRLEALDLLRRRDAILARVAASADDMFKAKDPQPACAALMQAICQELGLTSATAYLTGPVRPFASGLAPQRLIGTPLLSLDDLERPALAGWRVRLQASQSIHGPLELLSPEERMELTKIGIPNFAVLPIFAETSLFGIFVVTHSDRSFTWDPGLLDTLRLAADLIGAAFSRREQEERLMETGKMEALGRMAGGVAHEFNNLLHIISGNLRRITGEFVPPSLRAELVDKMIEATERGSRIVEQLLSATRQTAPAFRPTQLNEIIQKTTFLARPALRRDITLDLQLDPALPIVPMDPAQIQQVILNLLINANDAINGPGTITLSTGVTRGADGKSYIYACVADTGTGINPRDQDHIFDPFFTTKPPGKGSGLGLFTSRGILELHQGSITAANLKPRGAAFTFYLPLTTHKKGTQRIQPPPSAPIPMKAGRILLADDEPLCIDILRDTLEEKGFDCLTASNGEEALALAREHGSTIEWIITDWTMPGLHGRELVAQLRALLPRAGLIVCSGFVLEDEDMPEIDGLVVKPFNPDSLMRKLSEIAQARAAASTHLPSS